MTVCTSAGYSPESWERAINGHPESLGLAFQWVSTAEGHDYWVEINDKYSQRPLPQYIRDKLRIMYVEWKLTGDVWDNEAMSNLEST